MTQTEFTTTNYYIRFVKSQKQAKADLRRGFSFVDYILFDTRQDVLDHFGIEDASEVHLARDNGEMKGRWGIALNGLCGFGPFASEEEAEVAARTRRGYNGVEWPMAAIYTGHHRSDNRVWDGGVFAPETLVKVILL